MTFIELALVALIVMAAFWLVRINVAILAVGLFALLGLFFLAQWEPENIEFPPLDGSDTLGMATSKSCRSCHPGAWKSWHNSYHRTMTQRPSSEAFLGRVEEDLKSFGTTWRVERKGDSFWVSQTTQHGARKHP